MIRCILVDDEPLARERFKSLLEKSEVPIEVIAEAESGQKAIPMIYDLKPDIVFLDIQMPGLNGFEVVDLLAPPRPHLVFVTAYDEYALKAFEFHAIDYLLKPVRAERLNKTLQRVLDKNVVTSTDKAIESLRVVRSSEPLSRLTVHIGKRMRVVALEDIRRIEAEDKLVYVHLSDGKFRTDFLLDELESRLASANFIRVHRSHIVNIKSVKELIPWFSGTYCIRLDDGSQLPVARRRTSEVKSKLGGR